MSRIPVLVESDEQVLDDLTPEEASQQFWEDWFAQGLSMPEGYKEVLADWEIEIMLAAAQERMLAAFYDDAFERLHPRDRHGRFHSSWLTGGLIGISPSRSASPVLSEVVERFDSAEYQGFEQTVSRVTHRPEFNFESIRARRTIGFWEGDMEPSATIVFEGDVRHAERVAKELGGRYDQDAVALFAYDEEAPGARYLIKTDDIPAAIERTAGIGFTGASFLDDAVILYDMDGSQFDQAVELAKLLQSSVSAASGWVRFLEKGVDYEDDADHRGADQEGRGGRGDRDGHDQAEANGRDHAAPGHPQEVAFEEWTPQQATLHPRDKKGRFRKKLGGGAISLAYKLRTLVDGKKRAKQRSSAPTLEVVVVPPQTEGKLISGPSGSLVTHSAGIVSPKEIQRRQAAREKSAREFFAKDPDVQQALSDPAINATRVVTINWYEGPNQDEVTQLDVRLAVDKPEGWKSRGGDTYRIATHYDPNHMDDNGDQRGMFDPDRTDPLDERLMSEDELKAYIGATTSYDAAWTAISAAEMERLQRGESVYLGETPGRQPGREWYRMEEQLAQLPFEEAARPDQPAYLVQVKNMFGPQGFPIHPEIREVKPDDVRGIVEAHPVTIAGEIKLLTGQEDDPYKLQIATLYGFRPARDKILPNVDPVEGPLHTPPLVATTMLEQNRARLAMQATSDTGYGASVHGSMKARAMESVASRFDMKDPDVRAFADAMNEMINWDREGQFGDTKEQQLAAAVIKSWAKSSSDEHTVGHYMLWAAAREFGTPLNEWVGGPEFKRAAPGMHAVWEYLTIDDYDDEQMDAIRERMSGPAGFPFGEAFGDRILATVSEDDKVAIERGARKVLRAMYNATQEDLPGDKESLPEFLLYRGMRDVKETTVHGELPVGDLPVSQIRATANDAGGYGGRSWYVNFQRAATPEEVELLAKAHPEIGEMDNAMELLGGRGSVTLAPGVSWTSGAHYRALNWVDENARNAVPAAETDNGVIIYSLALADQVVRGMPETNVRPVYTGAELRRGKTAARMGPNAGTMVYGYEPGVLFGPQRQVEIPDPDVENMIVEIKASGYRDIPTARAKLLEHFLPMAAGNQEQMALTEKNLDAAIAAFSEAGWDTGPIEEAEANIRRGLEGKLFRDRQIQRGGILQPVTIKTEARPGWLAGGDVRVVDDVRANPMSSHATSVSATEQFGYNTLASIVPREDIIGMPGTGYGCLEENEIVVLGRTRRHVVKPEAAGEMPEPAEVERMLLSAESIYRPDIPLQPGAPEKLPSELQPDDPWFETNADVLDSFVWTTSDWDGNNITVDISPLAKWVDQNAGFEQDGEYRNARFTVFLDNVVRDDTTGKLAKFWMPHGTDDLSGDELWPHFQDAVARGMFDGNTTFHFTTMDEPYYPLGGGPNAQVDPFSQSVPVDPFAPDMDQAWDMMVASKWGPNLTSAIENALLANPNLGDLILIQGGPPASFQDPATGIVYDVSGSIPSQGFLDAATADVKDFKLNVQQTTPMAADADIAWHNVISGVMTYLSTEKPHAEQFAQVTVQVMESDEYAVFSLVKTGPGEPSDIPGEIATTGAVIQHDKTGNKYEFPGLWIKDQQALNDAVGEVKGFFLSETSDEEPWDLSHPFENDPGAPAKKSSPPMSPEALKVLPKGVAVLDPFAVTAAVKQWMQENAPDFSVGPPLAILTQIVIEANTVKKGDEPINIELQPDGKTILVWTSGPGGEAHSYTLNYPTNNTEMKDLVSALNSYLLPNLYLVGAGSHPLVANYAQADEPQPYIFIDGPENADWPKATWDFHDINSAAELDAYLSATHESAEHFMSQPVFWLNLDNKPAWLKLWAMQHTGTAFADWAPSAHPRWPKGGPKGGEFRSKLGGDIRAAIRAVVGGKYMDSRDGTLREGDDANISFQAKRDGKLVGTLWAEIPSPHTDKLQVWQIWVDPEHRDGQVLRQLLRAAQEKYDLPLTGFRTKTRREVGGPSGAPVDPDLLKDIDDILDEVLGKEAPAIDVGDYEVGDLVTVANPENWTHQDQFDEMQGKLWRVVEIDPEDEWPIKVEPFEPPEWGASRPIQTSFKAAHIERVEIPEPTTTDDEATNEARKLLAMPKLKLPGAARQDLTVEAKKKVQAKVQHKYDLAWRRASVALAKAMDNLPENVEYVYVWGQPNQPFQAASGAGLGYLYVPSKKVWLKSGDKPTWGDGYGRYQDQLWAKTGQMYTRSPVEDTNPTNFNSASEDEVMRVLLGAVMQDTQSVDVYMRDKDGEVLGYSAPSNERARWNIRDAMTLAAGDWLGYQPKRALDIGAYLDDFAVNTTITEPDGAMFVRDESGGWKRFPLVSAEERSRTGSAWTFEPDRLFTREEMISENEGWLEKHVKSVRQVDQVNKFNQEIRETVETQLPKDPEKLISNGAPGPLYVKQHQETMRVGKLLDEKFQAEWLRLSANVPDVTQAEIDRSEAENNFKLERERLRKVNVPVAADLLIQEVATEGNLSREDAEAAVLYSYSKSYQGPAQQEAHDMTYAQWKEDPSGQWDFLKPSVIQALGDTIITGDGTGVSSYTIEQIATGALKWESGWHDLPIEERNKNWYGVETKGAGAIAKRMVKRFPQEMFPSNLDKLNEEVKRARTTYALARDARKVAFRDAALKVIGDVREIGGGPKITYHKNTKKPAKLVTDEAYDLYPRDWQERVAPTANDLYVALTDRRGFYSYLGGPDGSDKIWASPASGGLPDQAVGNKERARFDTVVHELGHRFERNMPEIGAAEWTFWNYFARNRDGSFDYEQAPLPIEKMKAIHRKMLKKRATEGGRPYDPKEVKNYRSDEVGILDELPDEYFGKVYGGGGSNYYWELFTMAVEDLMTGGHDYLKEDADLRQWILGMLATV